MKSDIPEGKFTKIDTNVKMVSLKDIFSGKMTRERWDMPAPTKKVDAQKLFDEYVRLLNFYGSEMKRIKKDILPRLRKMIE